MSMQRSMLRLRGSWHALWNMEKDDLGDYDGFG
jgi:hypothetical protein